MENEKDLVVGIDLGTTNSLVARTVGGRPEIVRDANGERIFVPSVVSFRDDGSVLVGREARARAPDAPRRTVHSIKRLMGKGIEDLTEADRRLLPYELVETGDRKLVRVKIGEKLLTPQEVSAIILRELKRRAEAGLGCEVKKAVITVPAYFDDAQRQATRDAGKLAGLDVLRIINEPTAASLAYGLGGNDGKIAVYDLGGGTFDISILEIRSGTFRVLSTNGDTYLGGDDFDRVLVELAALRLQDERGIDARQDPRLLALLRDAAEKAKIELSTAEATTLSLRDEGRGIALDLPVTRAELEAAVMPLVERSLERCRRALEDAKVAARELDAVVLVGGVTRMPLVRRKVEELFGRRPHTDVDPDEVVALGAAVQADVLAGGTREVLLLDVTPLSLGIETFGGAVAKLIMRNSTIPTQASEEFTTPKDDVDSIVIHVLQGERELVRDCRSLAHFKLKIPRMPAGMPRLKVTFLIDADGILRVDAFEERSGSEASIEVVPVHGLTQDEVDRIYLESVEHALEDVVAHRLIDLRNEADAVLAATRKGLGEAGAALAPGARAAIEAAADALRTAVPVDDAERLQAALDALNKAGEPLAEVLLNRVAEATVKGKRIDDVALPKGHTS